MNMSEKQDREEVVGKIVVAFLGEDDAFDAMMEIGICESPNLLKAMFYSSIVLGTYDGMMENQKFMNRASALLMLVDAFFPQWSKDVEEMYLEDGTFCGGNLSDLKIINEINETITSLVKDASENKAQQNNLQSLDERFPIHPIEEYSAEYCNMIAEYVVNDTFSNCEYLRNYIVKYPNDKISMMAVWMCKIRDLVTEDNDKSPYFKASLMPAVQDNEYYRYVKNMTKEFNGCDTALASHMLMFSFSLAMALLK